MPVEFTTPPGRIVWGSCAKPRDVIDTRTKQKRTDADGNPRRQITFGLAIPKADAQPMLDAMGAAAGEEFPQGVPDAFAWKFKDGDTGVDSNGKPLREREGYAGCFVFALSTELVGGVPNYVYDHGAAKWVNGEIKTGDYVNVVVNMKAHKARSKEEKAGLYLNPTCVTLWQVGKEIKGGEVDPNARGFAPPPAQTPPAGASPPTPSAPAAPSAPAPGAPAAPAPQQHRQFLKGPRPDQ